MRHGTADPPFHGKTSSLLFLKSFASSIIVARNFLHSKTNNFSGLFRISDSNDMAIQPTWPGVLALTLALNVVIYLIPLLIPLFGSGKGISSGNSVCFCFSIKEISYQRGKEMIEGLHIPPKYPPGGFSLGSFDPFFVMTIMTKIKSHDFVFSSGIGLE